MSLLRARFLAVVLVATAGMLPLAAQSHPAAPVATPPAAQAVAPVAAYAEFELGKWAEMRAEADGGSAYVEQALQHYTAAMAADPQSAFLAAQKADLLSRLGRDQDALTLAQATVQAHPSSLVAHQTLGRIYLRELSRLRQPIPASAGDTMSKAVEEYKTLIQLDPGNADNVVVLGKLYGAEGNAVAAEQQFRQALVLSPTDLDAAASLIQSLASQDRLDEARKLVAALPPVARNGQVYAALGDAFSAQHRYSDAADAYRQAVEARPDVPQFQSALAKALMDGGDYQQALTAYQRLLQSSPNDGEAALRLAQLQMQLGQFAAASGNLKTARDLLGNDDLEVAYAGALLDESQGNNTRARSELQALVARKSNPATQGIFLAQLAHADMRAGDYDAATASIGQLSALGPSFQGRAHTLDIELYSDQRNFPQALQAARAAMASEPDSRSLQLTYANLLAATGATAQAETAVRSLMHTSAADWDLYLALGQIEAAAEQWPLADANIRRADQLAATPAEHARVAVQLGSILEKQKQFAAAETSYQHALQLAPGDAEALNGLGYLLADRGTRLPEALKDVERALAQDPGNANYLDTQGWIYLKMGRLPQAVTNLQKAADLQRHDPVILDHLAQAYDRNGDLSQAESNWQQALTDLKLNPAADVGSHQANAIEKKLDAVRKQQGKPDHRP
ncbi:MAG: tetratricopeptide repeat protein [Terriglobales bacterium]